MQHAPRWLTIVAPEARAVSTDPSRPFDLVLFDMDGTVVDEKSSWEWLHEHFGVSNEANWRAYQDGLLTDEQFMRSDIAMWRPGGPPIHRDEVEAILAKAPIMPGTAECVAELRKRGVTTAIMSGGIDLLARRVCVEAGIEMYVANGLTMDDRGFLAGEGILHVEIRDKGRPTRDLLKFLDVPSWRAAAVGNSIWDATMFREVGLGIAFNPFPDGVSEAADVTIAEKDLRLCLPHLVGPSA